MDEKYLQGYADLTESKETLNEKLANKVEKDASEIERRFLKLGKKEIYNRIFEIALYQNFEQWLMWMADELEADIHHYKKLIMLDGNILDFLVKYYNNDLRHPEYYNVFYSADDALTIINDAQRLIKEN